MADSPSLSAQEVAELLHVSKSTIYELIRRGEINSYQIGRKLRFTREDVDAYISRSRHESSTKPVKSYDISGSLRETRSDSASEFLISGQDVILDILANHLSEAGVPAGRSFLSGFEGLLALYNDRVDAVSCHIYCADTEEFNVPYIRALCPGIPAVLINLSYREQGFYVRAGNPKGITGWEDLRRDDLRILNRRTGSSARILLDGQLKKLGISPADLHGYDRIMRSHLTAAAAVAEDEADLCIGTGRVSGHTESIEFIPLIEERFDLVMKKEKLETENAQTLLHILSSSSFQKEISHFSGNDHRDLGRIIAEV